jgi:hypothetical protein
MCLYLIIQNQKNIMETKDSLEKKSEVNSEVSSTKYSSPGHFLLLLTGFIVALVMISFLVMKLMK